MGKISPRTAMCNWLELEDEEESEDPLLGLPFVVGQRQHIGPETAFSSHTNSIITEFGSEEEAPFDEPHCFLGCFSKFLQHVRAQQHDNTKLIVPPQPLLIKNEGPASVASKAPEADSLSCAATSVNSSVDGDTDSRRERRRCILRDGGIQIEALDFPEEHKLKVPSRRRDGHQHRRTFEYQEYLSSRR